ncbi:c-type cytochrome [bacterium]|nr:MAG: c-type cytochrome [bacterium]
MKQIFYSFLNGCVFVALLSLMACDKEKISEDPQITLGRQLFNDTKFDNIAGQTYSCATCHPSGDMDHKKWLLPPISTDSIATPTLFGVVDTPPYLWFGEGGSEIKTVTRVVIDSVLHGSATEEELDALTAYQLSLAVPANPWRNSDGSLTTQQQKGKTVFEGQGKCNVCHSGEALTGKFKIQIKKLNPQVDVPSLRWVFATAPYFRDHSAATLWNVVNHYADSVQTVQMTTWGWNTLGIYDISLTEQEKTDLIEYLKTL